jgi:hypothetical protein
VVGLCTGGSCSADGSQGGASTGGGFVALVGDWGASLLGISTSVNLPFGQGLNFTVDGFEATPAEAIALLSSGAGQPGFSGKGVTVPENVILDSQANGGQGLTCEQVCKFKDIQKKMEQFYAQIGIQFQVSYTDGQIVWSGGGNHIVDILGPKKGDLNVFVFGGNLPLAINGPWGDWTGASGIESIQDKTYAMTYIGLLNTTAHTLEHEFTHHFLGETLGKGSWFTRLASNTNFDLYVNQVVLPNITKYGDTMRSYSQEILNP